MDYAGNPASKASEWTRWEVRTVENFISYRGFQWKRAKYRVQISQHSLRPVAGQFIPSVDQ